MKVVVDKTRSLGNHTCTLCRREYRVAVDDCSLALNGNGGGGAFITFACKLCEVPQCCNTQQCIDKVFVHLADSMNESAREEYKPFITPEFYNNNREATLKPQVAAADPSPFVGNHTCTECGETSPLSYKWCDITYKVGGTPNLRFPCTLCHKMQNQDDSEMTKKGA